MVAEGCAFAANAARGVDFRLDGAWRLPGRVSGVAGGKAYGVGILICGYAGAGARGFAGIAPGGGFRTDLPARPAKNQASRGGIMSESMGATVVPFAVGDDERESRSFSPTERPHLAEAMRMAEAIVFASAEPVSEKQLAQR